NHRDLPSCRHGNERAGSCEDNSTQDSKIPPVPTRRPLARISEESVIMPTYSEEQSRDPPDPRALIGTIRASALYEDPRWLTYRQAQTPVTDCTSREVRSRSFPDHTSLPPARRTGVRAGHTSSEMGRGAGLL